MKAQFSLTALLICVFVFAIVSAVCKVIPVPDIGEGILYKPVFETLEDGSRKTRLIPENSKHAPISRPPTLGEFGFRVAWAGTTSVAITLIALRLARKTRLKQATTTLPDTTP